MKRLLVGLLVLWCSSALAEPVTVKLELPQGLMAGKVPVVATVAGVQGGKVSVSVDPGNGLAAQEVLLDTSNKGELELAGVAPSALVTVKVQEGGRNYAETQAYGNQRALQFVMDEPRSRSSETYPLLPWAAFVVIMGLLAIRGKSAAF